MDPRRPIPGRRLALALLLAGPLPAAAQTFDDIGGAFSPSTPLSVASGPYAPVAADLNGDGKPDLVVGNEHADSVQVLLNNGAGGFSAPITLSAGDGAQGVAVADLNADGKPDLVAANLWASTVSVFLGNGSGGFALAGSPATGANPHAVVVDDFNGDGKKDLATADGGGGASVLLGDGLGGFAAAASVFTGSNPRDLRSADFNGDGKRDLVVSNEGGDSLAILLGNGLGGFAPAATYPAGDAPQTVAVGDLDGDGKMDVVAASANGAKASVYRGLGDGAFTAWPDVPAGHALVAAALADLDGNGALDLVLSRGDVQLEVRMGQGTGGFGASTAVSPGGDWMRIAVADIDMDGKPDLVGSAPDGTGSHLLVSRNESVQLNVAPSATVDATSSYALRKPPIWINRQADIPYPTAFFSHAGYADIDRDGDVDVLRTFSNNADAFPVQMLVNDGAGGFSDQTATRIVGPQPGVYVARKILAGDYNSDGWPDFFVSPHGIDLPPFPGEAPQLFLSNGNGTLRHAPGLEGDVGFHHAAASADVDGNGTVDILVADTPSFLLLNDGSGNFVRNSSRLPTRAGGQPFFFFTAELVDVDGDGFIDLLTAGHEQDGMPTVIHWGGANGIYRDARSTTIPSVPNMGVCLDFIVEDIDHDGRKDLLVNRTGSTQSYVGRDIQVLRQTSARVFADQSAARIAMDKSLPPFDFFRGQDINGDGHVDILVDDRKEMASGQYAWVNDGAGVFSPYAGPVTLPVPPVLSVSSPSVAEGHAGSKTLDFTVTVSPVSGQSVSFGVLTGPGTALPGEDYQPLDLAGLVIPPGQSSLQVPVTIVGDTEVEEHETLTLNLVNVLGAGLYDSQGRGRIVNDDLAQLSVRDATVVEGDAGVTTLSFAVELSSPMPNPVTYDIATVAGTATAGADFIARSLAGRFLDAGRTRQSFEVGIQGDAQVEPGETFTVVLSNVEGAALGDASATGTIANDDVAAAKSRRPARPRAVPRR